MKLLAVGDVFDSLKLASNARYVVEKTVFDGGGSQREMSGRSSMFPNGHHVHARRLAPDCTYDPDGEAVDFFQSGSFTSDRMIEREDIRVVGKMKMTFVRA